MRVEWITGNTRRAREETRTIANHYQAIGLLEETLDALEHRVLEALASARHLPSGSGMSLTVWEDPSGAALWAQLQDGVLVGAHPFYARATRHEALLEGLEPDEDSPFDGRALLLLPGPDAVPIPADVVNWPIALQTLRPGAAVTAALAAIAETWRAWDSTAAFLAEAGEAGEHAARRVEPTGLRPIITGGTGRATSQVAGVVMDSGTRTNTLTRAPFIWMRLDTACGALDIVAAGAHAPPPGGVVRGHFWIAAALEP